MDDAKMVVRAARWQKRIADLVLFAVIAFPALVAVAVVMFVVAVIVP